MGRSDVCELPNGAQVAHGGCGLLLMHAAGFGSQRKCFVPSKRALILTLRLPANHQVPSGGLVLSYSHTVQRAFRCY